MLYGAIIGDIVGSRFEFNNHKSKKFELFTPMNDFTDDTVMTIAVATALKEERICNFKHLEEQTIYWMKKFGKEFPNRGYGGMFGKWLYTPWMVEPYNSFGNGAAMRVSACAYYAKSLEEAKELSKKVTAVTHNHPEGIKGAEATTVAIYMALMGKSKEDIKRVIERDYYDLSFTLDEIRKDYLFDETCQNTVPQAIVAFLESENFEDAIRNAVSIGGDSDTIAAITGSIAEAFYGVPKWMEREADKYIEPIYRKCSKAAKCR